MTRAGQAYPEIANLIQISNLFNVTVDYLVRDQECMISCADTTNKNIEQLIAFRLETNVNTYAAYANQTESTRFDSHDFSYSNGSYTYHDTYIGGEQFAGEEAIWYEGKAQYAMNYAGRVTGQQFSGNFLKEAIRKADRKMLYAYGEFIYGKSYQVRENKKCTYNTGNRNHYNLLYCTTGYKRRIVADKYDFRIW